MLQRTGMVARSASQYSGSVVGGREEAAVMCTCEGGNKPSAARGRHGGGGDRGSCLALSWVGARAAHKRAAARHEAHSLQSVLF